MPGSQAAGVIVSPGGVQSILISGWTRICALPPEIAITKGQAAANQPASFPWQNISRLCIGPDR